MAAAGGTWARRTSGTGLLVFFLSLIVLTYLAVVFWNGYDMAATGSLTLLAAVLPLELLSLFYFAAPVWALQTPADTATVERAVRTAVGSAKAEPLAEHKGVFRACTSVVRVSEPPCTVGWWQPDGARPPVRSLIFVVGGSADKESLARFRTAIAEGLARPAASA